MYAKQQLTKEALDTYRKQLAELDRARRQAGIPPSRPLETALWRQFDPKSQVGFQIYESYSDAQLLGFMLETMDHPGHSPLWDEIFYVYQVYIRRRFGNSQRATQRARAWRKHLAERERWPPDWPEHVSCEKVAVLFAARNCPLSAQEAETLRQFCRTVQLKRTPPQEGGLPEEIKRLFRMRGLLWQKGLELMGIPFLNKRALKHLMHYWKQALQKKDVSDHG